MNAEDTEAYFPNDAIAIFVMIYSAAEYYSRRYRDNNMAERISESAFNLPGVKCEEVNEDE